MKKIEDLKANLLKDLDWHLRSWRDWKEMGNKTQIEKERGIVYYIERLIYQYTDMTSEQIEKAFEYYNFS